MFIYRNNNLKEITCRLCGSEVAKTIMLLFLVAQGLSDILLTCLLNTIILNLFSPI